ncbi:MAG TPA: dTDP-4-dehydrorhamnose reductase [Pseudonocardiaceae bacterium]|nr:dTDP-4-dehydrorhamnose reductase [Pseudonocardiaceae bacterium]
MVQLALLVPGGRGQLGSDLAVLGPRHGTVWAPNSAELNIADEAAVRRAVAALVAGAADRRPVVINAAGYTAVDAAESDVGRAHAANALGPGLLARACVEHGVSLLHVSTDYVFPGDGSRPYEPDDRTGPASVYGRTKLAGESAVLESGADAWVVRTAWVYGAAGGNFVKTVARLERSRDTLSVVDDQRGSPTWSADLAAGLLELATAVGDGRGPAQRALHATNGGETTWFGLARAVFEELGADPERVHPCTTAEYPRPAPRPAYSVLSDAAWRKAGLAPLPHWRDALATFATEHTDVLR